MITLGARHRSREFTLMAFLIAAPALFSAVWILALEGYRLLQPASALFASPAPLSLADAIMRDDVEGAFAIIRRGQDPNQVIEASDPVITGGRLVRVSPLLLAVAARGDKTVGMLLGFGARMELPLNSRAACLADAIGDERIARLLRMSGKGVDASACPASDSASGPPLLAFTDD